jgi:RNA polymerase-binding transcription factor DksA
MAEVEGFYRFCVHCTTPVPEPRLARMTSTCSNECAKADRRSARRFKHDLRRKQYQTALKRKLAALEAVRYAHAGATA